MKKTITPNYNQLLNGIYKIEELIAEISKYEKHNKSLNGVSQYCKNMRITISDLTSLDMS